MSCDYPVELFRVVNPDTGKTEFKGAQAKTEDSEPYLVRCGQCIGCGLDRANEWAIRAMQEAQMHEENQFLTLTYDDDHLPADWSLRPHDVRRFVRRLRRKYSGQLKYMVCGEYGGEGSRPHYHMIVFGLELPDKEVVSTNKNGDRLYRSEQLESVWKNGFVQAGAVTHQTAAYVASYTLKDTSIKSRDKEGKLLKYTVTDKDTGEIQERRRPFFHTSTNGGGIGASWFAKYGADVISSGKFVYRKGKEFIEMPALRYHLKLHAKADELDAEALAQAKAVEADRPEKRKESTRERREVKASVREAKMKQRRRGSEKTAPEQNAIGKVDGEEKNKG